MTTKFNKDIYAKMRSKRDEPLSNIGKRAVRVTRKGPPVTPTASVTSIVSDTETVRTASPATSIERIPTPTSKKPRMTDKWKEKADSHSFCVWDDVELVVERVHRVFTAEDLKVFSNASFNEVATRHVHKLVQVTRLCNFLSLFFFFSLYWWLQFSFLGVGGESSYYFQVPNSRSQGGVSNIQDEGFRGRELPVEEKSYRH